MKKAVFAQGAPAAIGPYSHGVAIGDLFFTSGQIALVPETGKLVDGGIQEQTEQVLRNLEMVLSANGMTFANVVKPLFLSQIWRTSPKSTASMPRASPTSARPFLRTGGSPSCRLPSGNRADRCKSINRTTRKNPAEPYALRRDFYNGIACSNGARMRFIVNVLQLPIDQMGINLCG